MGNDVIQGLRILSVSVEADEVFVDVYGSDDGVCGSIRFRFGRGPERTGRVRTLRRWASEGTPVTFLQGEGVVTLMSERGSPVRPVLD